MSDMTNAEIRELADRPGYTPEPWTSEDDGDGMLVEGVIRVPNCYDGWREDAALITDAPRLLTALRTVLRRYDEAVKLLSEVRPPDPELRTHFYVTADGRKGFSKEGMTEEEVSRMWLCSRIDAIIADAQAAEGEMTHES